MRNHTKVLILAAGKGKRMKSTKPKVLHELAGKSMIMHIIDKCISSGLKDIYIVLGEQKHQILNAIKNTKVKVINQKKQLGTADAINSAKKHLGEFNGRLLILYGDMPLITEEIIKKIIHNTNNSFSLVGFISENPKGYGRIINKDAQIESKRIGSNNGTHEVIYESFSDLIRISHTAKNRDSFALGSIVCAQWIISQNGFFEMDDFLNDFL